MKHWVAVAFIATTACQAELDTTRTVDSYASFGDAIYREACQRVAYTGQLDQQAAGTIAHVDVSGSLGRAVCVAGEAPPDGAPPALFALAGEHPGVTATVDIILPQPFLATLEGFLEQILPLYDDGTMDGAITALGKLLGDMHDDADFSAAVSRIGVRHGYRPSAPGLIHDLLAYPDIDNFIGSFLGLIGPGGAAEQEWGALMAAGAATFQSFEPEVNPADPNRTLTLALDVLFSTNANDPALVGGAPRIAVKRDVRGMALVATDSKSGAVVPPFVDLDQDGLADTDASGRFIDAHGVPLAVPTPFAEPGVVDLAAARDAQGRALTASGATTTLYQYFDLDGTVLIGAAREAPTLLDADKDTALGLAWGASALMGPRTTQTKIYTSSTTGAQLSSVTFNGFDTTKSPALDLLHSFIQVLGAPNVDQVLQATQLLLTAHESETARVIGDMLATSDLGKTHAEAQLPAQSTVYDELAPLIARVFRVDGLPEDLLAALGDPHVKAVAPMIARLMVANDQIDFNHTNAAIGSARGAPDYDVIGNLDSPHPVDRTQPDVDYNRSLMQRIGQLIHDSNGIKFCNKAGASALGLIYAQCKLFEIDDLSLFFVLNMASDSIRMDKTRLDTTYNKASFRAQLVDPIALAVVTDDDAGDKELEQQLIKINGFKRFPSPKALVRALFLRPTDSGESGFLLATTNPLTCLDGDRFIDVHDKSLVAWETTLPNNPSGFADDTFYDAVKPLVDAFAKHDECVEFDDTHACTKFQNAAKIFVDLLSVLHEHWASPQSKYFGHSYQHTDRTKPRFSFPDNLVSFEPLVSSVINDQSGVGPAADLVPSLLAIAPVLLNLKLGDGTDAFPALSTAVQYVFDPTIAPAGLAYRDGRTLAVASDGVTPLGRATPYDLIADGFAEKRAALDALSATDDGAVQAGKWRAATSALVDQVLTVDHPDATTWQFHNRRFHAITQALVDFTRKRVQAHTAAGDLATWVTQTLTSDLTDKLASPVFAALGDLVAKIEHDDAARGQFYGLANYLLDETGNDQVFRTGLTFAADQTQQFLDDRNLVPVSRLIGAAMDPTQHIVTSEIALVKKSHDLDTNKALLTILRAMFQPDANSIQPESTLVDLITTVDRATPGHTDDLDPGDEASVLAALRDFFADNARGFLRFVAIVHNRNG